jgi:hypothetical protein
MISRADAMRAKEAMEKNRTPDSQLRVCSEARLSPLALANFNRPDGA